MGRTSDARADLISTAANLFYTTGYNAVGVQEICAAAGVKKGSFYYFFESKQALAAAVIDTLWENYRGHFLREVFEAGDSSTIQRFVRFFELTHRRISSAPGPVCGCHFGNLAVELAAYDPVLRDKLQHVFSDWIGVLDRALQTGVAAGELRAEVDTHLLAEAVMALYEGMAVLGKTYNDAAVIQRMGQRVELLLRPYLR